MIRLSRVLPIIGGLAVTPAGGMAQQPQSLPGRYDFRAVTLEGDSIWGTVHITAAAGGYSGRVMTTVVAPLPITEVRVGDSLVTVVTPRVSFRWVWTQEAFAGEWQIGNERGALEGRRVPTEPHNSLRLVRCRVQGMQEVVRCGTLFVQENRSDPASRRIPLNIVVLPAASPPAEGALYHFAGGPGQAATEQAAGNARRFARIRPRRDIVMVDQRGTGGSNGLFCRFAGVDERAAALFGGFFPDEVALRCREDLGTRADLRFYHTAVAAEDVEDVRIWLGYERLDLYGGSYGTRAALAYLRAHPDRVRTMTIRGIMAPSGSLSADNPADAQVSLDRLFDDCERDASCGAAFPSLRDEFGATLRALSERPAPVRVLDPVTGDSVTIAITRGVFAGSVRRMLMDAGLRRRLPLAIHEASQGGFETIRTGVERTIGIAGTLAWGMGLSVVCAEDPPILARRDVGRAIGGTFLGRWQVDGVERVCPQWPAGTPPRGYDAPVRADTPALLLSGALDPTTPPRWGDEVARTLPNAVHVVMAGISHSPFPDCALDVMAAMIEAGTTEGLDTTCFSALRRAPFVTEVP